MNHEVDEAAGRCAIAPHILAVGYLQVLVCAPSNRVPPEYQFRSSV